MVTIPTATVQAQEILRVDIENGTTTDDGSDWGEDAIQYLQDALARAEVLLGPPFNAGSVEIWVAQGTYLPNQGQNLPQVNDQREHSFHLLNNVRLYGGFSGNGTETELHQRNPDSNPTILSGNLDDDEEEFDNNIFNVVKAENVDSTAMLNGFTITHGNAPNFGGGLLSLDASPLIIRCTFTNNHANGGGGVTALGTWAVTGPTIVNSRFVGNTGISTAGGLYYQGVDILVVNSVFWKNVGQANTYGAAVIDYGTHGSAFSKARFVNCTWHGNECDVCTEGGLAFQGIFPGPNPPEFINCIIWGNSTENPVVEGWEEEIRFRKVGSTTDWFILENTCLRGYDETDLGGTNNIADDPKFVSPSTGNLRLQPGSPAIDIGANSEVVDDVWNITDDPM